MSTENESGAARLAKMLREQKKYPIHAVYRDSTTLDFTEVDAIAIALERADRLERAADKAVYHDACDGWHGDLRAALATGKEGGK